MTHYRHTICSFFILCLALLQGCEGDKASSEEQTLRVITRNGITTYYEDKDGPTGYEYELAKGFANKLGLKLEITTVQNLEQIFSALANGKADIAAAGLTITPERKKHWLFSPPYLQVQQHVIYNQSTHKKPRSIEDLYNTQITVMAKSSHSEILNQLKENHPALNWHAATDVEIIDLLDRVNSGEIDFTLIDSNEFLANRGFYPQLRQAIELGEAGNLAWILPDKPSSQQLLEQIKSYFQEIEENGSLQQLEERFYSHVEHLGQISTNTFAKAVEKKLPRYRELIEQVANKHQLDWRLLASISYQESHWNPRARSPTGVRGMMMLTRLTAREMKVTDRLDAKQSLEGGAAYYNKLKKRLPKSIKEPDRTWFTLAAYNVGLGHIKDVRTLTRRQGGDPDKWADIKERLPLLQKRRWYSTTRYGYARGQEALTYVQNIRHFYNYLEWSELNQNRTPPPKRMEQYLPDSLQREFNAL